MSHCISAIFDGKEHFITAGSNFKTINAVAASGFDIYGLFNAYEAHNGMSGAASTHQIDFTTATNAYKHAIAWVQALETSFPIRYKSDLNSLNELKPEFLNCLWSHPFTEAEIETLTKEKIEDQTSLNENQVVRAFYLFYSILPFTHDLYHYTRKGAAAKLNFT